MSNGRLPGAKMTYQRLPSRTEVPRAEQPAAPGITRVSHTHEAILQYMIANPAAQLSEVAAEFGYTQPWLSNIIYSDCFQAKLADAQGEIFGEVKTSVKDRITTLAHRSLTRLAEKIEIEQDTARITDAAELALKAIKQWASWAERMVDRQAQPPSTRSSISRPRSTRRRSPPPGP
jgi:hypothetical protein